MTEKKTSEQILSALLHVLYNFFIYFIFVVPFDLWKKATNRLANQREKGGLDLSKNTSNWPFLSFLNTFIIDFLIDGYIFMVYVLALPAAIIMALVNDGGFATFLTTLISAYFVPVGMSLLRDLLQLLMLPFNKFLSWASKPAQYMDLEIRNK